MITVLVYGAVALIVKMDDVGLHLAERRDAASRQMGSFVAARHADAAGLARDGRHAGDALGRRRDYAARCPRAGPACAQRHGSSVQHAVEQATGPLGPTLGWLTYAVLSAIAGLVLGALVAVAVHAVQKATGLGKGAN